MTVVSTGYKMCSRGLHELTPDNTYRTVTGIVAGVKRFGGERCKQCRRDNGVAWRATRDADKPKRTYTASVQKCVHGVWSKTKCPDCKRARDQRYRDRKRVAESPEGIDLAVKTSLDYLKLRGEAGRASDRLNAQIEYKDARPLKCERPVWMVNADGEPFEGFVHTDFPDFAPPSVVDAALMCQDCPVAALCLEYGRALRAKSIVYGGFLFNDKGKIVGGSK